MMHLTLNVSLNSQMNMFSFTPISACGPASEEVLGADLPVGQSHPRPRSRPQDDLQGAVCDHETPMEAGLTTAVETKKPVTPK